MDSFFQTLSITTESFRADLAGPSGMQVPYLRRETYLQALRDEYPPFLAMLDSVEARGPMYGVPPGN